MTILKQSTAAAVQLGPFVDATDGCTAETGLTIAAADIRLSKNAGDFGAATAGATHDENGYYTTTLSAANTNTLGNLRIAVSVTGALPVWEDCLVVTEAAWNSMIGGSVGGTVVTYTVTEVDTGDPVPGATVEMYSDSGRTALVARAVTDSLGVATFVLADGTYYPRVIYGSVLADNAAITVS